MKPLKIGITGVGGVVGESFTPELVVEFAQVFGTTWTAGGFLFVETRALPGRWYEPE